MPAATPSLPASIAALGRARPFTVWAIGLMLAGGLVLPQLYGILPFARMLDYGCAFALAGLATFHALRRAGHEGPAAFRRIALGAALGGLHYVPTLLPLPYAALTGPALSILGLLALGTGFLAWPWRRRLARDRMRNILESLGITLSVFTVAWLLMGSLSQVGDVSRSVMTVYLAQIATCLGVLTFWMIQRTSMALPEQAPAKRFVGLALLLLLAHCTLTAAAHGAGLYWASFLGHLTECLHQAASACLALAALSPVAKAEDGVSARVPLIRGALFPSVTSFAALILVALRIGFSSAPPSRSLLVLIILLMVVRFLAQGLMVVDLERLSLDLEARVEERTRRLEALHRATLADVRAKTMASLAAGLSHDLANVLNVIRLRLGLLRETAQPGQEKDLDVLEEASERAVAMTNRIKASSRLQETTPVPVDIPEWLTSRSGLLRAILGPGQHLETGTEGALTALVDPSALDQILENLASNARDAMGPCGRLVIRATAGPGLVRLEVRDDGPGIPPDRMPRLFEPFFTTKATGTGLGLPTVRNLVLQNHGSIQVESEPGQGAAFIVELPAAP